MLYKAYYTSPLGTITLLSNADYLLGLWFNDQKHYAANYDLTTATSLINVPIKKTEDWLTQYFAGEVLSPAILPLKPEVTVFRNKVLNILKNVPYGETITYGEIASKLEKPGSARAVGGAVGHNPIAIVIPCHRVLGSNHTLTGYAGGIDRKVALLSLEKLHKN
ncbi:methylated-DNA--[protein]-cysteine S-methyltransferase [Ligilactobacillus sp. WILCCON 0076]|uniref:Methylated-DNA--protein-cysteine methyltransferase n=1 Tax=Ligilactobacillus ubinensis TaxID=2876789 RepID=A0A9X2FLW7_9LACO|nr:methylated-DNA--[protein]-cysteine S-methyltransferase [Ligilactobacillus ubinensis]MCP0888064.1 methylated-DNA--[protein]-cysteine S-methyltransferase [Ligilactobacillus ubinensis]